VKRVAIIASASGSGKTTVGRELARRLGVPYHELDALHHGPSWTEATLEELRARVEPLVAEESWVIDGSYRGKLGDLVLAAAETVVWLDLPMRVWLPRLLRRTYRRWRTREELWSGNRETVRGSLLGRNALIPYAIRTYRKRRRRYPVELAEYQVVRLRSEHDIATWLNRLGPGGQGANRRDDEHQHR
jgi:adenylate kinase family enzyme